MTCEPKVKAPGAKLDYGFNWADGYLDVGSPIEIIATSVWSIRPGQGSPPEIEIVTGSDSIDLTSTMTSVSVQGGTLGHRYELVNEITTTVGRSDERSIEIRIANP